MNRVSIKSKIFYAVKALEKEGLPATSRVVSERVGTSCSQHLANMARYASSPIKRSKDGRAWETTMDTWGEEVPEPKPTYQYSPEVEQAIDTFAMLLEENKRLRKTLEQVQRLLVGILE